MIVSKIKMEFSGAAWASPGKASEGLRQVFKHAAKRGDDIPGHNPEVERMSISQLLYFALVGQSAQV